MRKWIFAAVALLAFVTLSFAQPESESMDITTLVPEGYSMVDYLSDETVQQFSAAEEVLSEGQDYYALIVTNKGSLLVDLFEEGAPLTVNNFAFLSLNHYYDGIIFHRVLDNFMAQTGDPTGTGTGGPGYQFADEFNSELRHSGAGVLSMANSGPNTNGSQIFITFVDTPHLDDRHSVFGQVVEENLAVLDDLTRVEPGRPPFAYLDETVAQAAARGLMLEADDATLLRDLIEEAQGNLPQLGENFVLDGYRLTMGRAGERLAVAFYDRIESVAILTKN